MIDIHSTLKRQSNRRGAKECEAFKELMIRKFEQRAYRGDWKGMPAFAAWQNLNDEIHELCDAVSRCDRPNMIEEAIDVANSCLILVDVLKGLEAVSDT